jgi:transposase
MFSRIGAGLAMSLAIAAAQRIFVYRSACDMRRSFDRLAAMVEHELDRDVMRGDYFLFANRRGTMVKLLYWDGDGFAIWFKRLERGTFRVESKDELDRAELSLLLEGVQTKNLRRLPRYKKLPR